MKPAPRIFLKALLSVPVGYGLAYPFFHPEAGGGILAEMQRFGQGTGAAVALVFLALVYLYARDLKTSLSLVSPQARRASPASVWLMFLLPYNFIEDFCIVANVARSLEAQARSHAGLARFRSFGLASGIGWCAAQLVSLLPNALGSAAGLAALVFWAWHWAFIRRANRVLGQAAEPASRQVRRQQGGA
ncbi:hypothetical protein [Cupriavidus malaysiensis]|uniref:DUF4328 domain-containing protein n=1 Tax=Cupriavidus malaysiensis TaxID=367825 RepID=A0ABN4TVC8_9BURK|nr:hypothetical protein [Cupriavidus malaysiensis]AOZ09635.1 hypothetical protein BKK80_28360 [Cupriavidus malaysiensis]